MRIRNEELGVFCVGALVCFSWGADNISPGPARAPTPTANLEMFRHASPRPNDHPREAPCRRGQKVSSISHGRQQAGEGRVGSRSAEKRGGQGTGFDGKGILKDHRSLSASLVSFCARRKKLALRRNRSRTLRKEPLDAGRGHGTPFRGHRGRSPLYLKRAAGGFTTRSPPPGWASRCGRSRPPSRS